MPWSAANRTDRMNAGTRGKMRQNSPPPQESTSPQLAPSRPREALAAAKTCNHLLHNFGSTCYLWLHVQDEIGREGH